MSRRIKKIKINNKHTIPRQFRVSNQGKPGNWNTINARRSPVVTTVVSNADGGRFPIKPMIVVFTASCTSGYTIDVNRSIILEGVNRDITSEYELSDIFSKFVKEDDLDWMRSNAEILPGGEDSDGSSVSSATSSSSKNFSSREPALLGGSLESARWLHVSLLSSDFNNPWV